MSTQATDKLFAGSIPELYDTCRVPLIFEPYALDLAGRVAARRPQRVLEIAAGTGVVTRAMVAALADDVAIVATDLNPPPRFLARTPHGYHERDVIEHDLARAGWPKPPAIDTLAARSRAATPHLPALAYCQGTPLRNEIEARNAGSLAEATELCASAIARRFGAHAVDGKIQAHIVVVET